MDARNRIYELPPNFDLKLRFDRPDGQSNHKVLLNRFLILVVFGLVLLWGRDVQAQTEAPTKADLVKTLEMIYPLLEAQDYDAAAKHVVMPPRMSAEMLSGILKSNELSLDGIQLLAKDAKFDKATVLFGAERAQSLAEKMGADINKCWGFFHETKFGTGEIIAQWDGDAFKLVRIDDVGKIAGAPIEKKGTSAPRSAENEDPETTLRNAAELIQKLQAEVEQNPNDASTRAKLAMAFYQVGNYPAAWTQLMSAYRLDPKHAGVSRGIDSMINVFTTQGVFTVGVPPETIQGLLGEPTQKLELKARTRWRYAHWGIDFSENDRVGEIIDLRGATNALFQPTEKISTDLGGETWLVGFRRKQKGKAAVYYFTPGETMSSYSQLITVERIHDVPGELKSIVQEIIEQEKKLNPDSNHKILESGQDSAILATRIPGKQKPVTRHQLIRLWKGPKDLHRLTYTMISEDDPSKETQKKWLEIFQKATLDPVN